MMAGKRKRRSILPVVLTICIMTVLIGVALAAFFFNRMNKVSGEWTRDIDITDEVISKSALWMSEIEGVHIDMDWVKGVADKQGYKAVINLDLTMAETVRGQGTYDLVVDTNSYDECKSDTYALLAECLNRVVADRLTLVGYADNVSADEAVAITEEVLGQSLESYLQSKNMDMVPGYEVLSDKYSSNGSYVFNTETITWTNDKAGETYTESYIVDSDMLIFPESEIIYRKQVADEIGL